MQNKRLNYGCLEILKPILSLIICHLYTLYYKTIMCIFNITLGIMH